MNTWEIMKKEFSKNSRPETMGRDMDINNCAHLFIKIMHNLKDREESIRVFNDDSEVKNAIISSVGIQELKEAGVLR